MTATARPWLGIVFIVVGMIAISVNDMLIKALSGAYPLHEIVFLRSAIGLIFGLMLVQMEGGWRILRTGNAHLHLLRGLLVVVANMAYFLALAAMPLADATALFFVAPLFITLLSVPLLGEKVGPLRLGAVLVGFAGVLVMQRPWQSGAELEVSRLVLLLPVLSALTYALMQLMTRRLGVSTKASVLAVWIQVTFIAVALGFFAVAGDGRFAQGVTSPSLVFLLRAWVWPTPGDWLYLTGLGLNSAIIGYCLSQAYRMSDAATVAPFEYIALPLAVLWGWLIWRDVPGLEIWIGMVLIVASGLFVFLREQQKSRHVARTEIKRR